jgi:DNA-binding protein H-NS
MDENEIKVLLEIKEDLERVIRSKQEQIDMIESEVETLHQKIGQINKLISQGTFTTAAMLLDAEAAAQKAVSSEAPPSIKKIFAADNNLIAVLKYENEQVNIRFPHPSLLHITQEIYLTQIIKPIFLPLKSTEPNMKIDLVTKEENQDVLITNILLQNIGEYESFLEIFEKFSQYLSQYIDQ